MDGVISISAESALDDRMTMNPKISTNITVKELLASYPQLLQPFLDMGLMCAGCPTEAFHTLEDVAREYHLDLKRLHQSIYTAIGDDGEHELK